MGKQLKNIHRCTKQGPYLLYVYLLFPQVMVPFGSLAFMPGRLLHTNEILVLLGDNWFAERSAKQAVEIVQRRLKGGVSFAMQVMYSMKYSLI